MKKISTIALMFILLLGFTMPTYAQEKKSSMEELLKPYEDVINKLNNELGSDPKMYIPDESKDKVYENIKDISLKEFEDSLRSQYKTVVEMNDNEINENPPTIHPLALIEDITQTTNISYNSKMYLESRISSGTGSPGTFIYTKIYAVGATYPSNYDGYHFHVDRGTWSVSSDKKKCTVTLVGHPQNAYGVVLAIQLTEKVTFSAG